MIYNSRLAVMGNRPQGLVGKVEQRFFDIYENLCIKSLKRMMKLDLSSCSITGNLNKTDATRGIVKLHGIFEIIKVISMKITVFLEVTPCTLVDNNQNLGGTCVLKLQVKGNVGKHRIFSHVITTVLLTSSFGLFEYSARTRRDPAFYLNKFSLEILL
jgi:hypothetical protein